MAEPLEEGESQAYAVVINHEEQYSIWPADRSCPAGWQQTGMRGSKDACLAHIEEVWTDMRPLSIRAGQQPT
jgi:MbtH protein